MKPEWISAYLIRIKYQGSHEPVLENLLRIHQAHLLAVPFEDLDIHYGIPLSLDAGHLFNKVVVNNRGGFCYELNHLFGLLLLGLGFQVTRVAAQVFDDKDCPGPYYDHMALLVELDETWLADVGFGSGSFLRPICLTASGKQNDPAGDYLINELDSKRYQVLRARQSGEFRPLYNFDKALQAIDDFTDECLLKQIDANSHFVRNKICTMATIAGRKTLLNNTFSNKIGMDIQTTPVMDQQVEKKILLNHFGISI